MTKINASMDMVLELSSEIKWMPGIGSLSYGKTRDVEKDGDEGGKGSEGGMGQ